MLLKLGTMRLIAWMALTFVGFLISFWVLLNAQDLIYSILPERLSPDISTLLMMVFWLGSTMIISGIIFFAITRTTPKEGEPDVLDVLRGKETPEPDVSVLDADLKAQYREEALKLMDTDQFNDKNNLDR